MASINDDSSPDRKRKKCTRKGPHDIIKKTAVVLREGVVFKNKETGEVFMPTTITMSNEINPDPGLRQEISFTRSYTPEDMKEVAKNAFPILANTESFSFAKAVQKAKLDFCGERHIWSGEVLNREIKGHCVLYIFYEEENGDQHPSLIAQVENMQISGNESLSEDRSDSGVETCNNSQDTSKNPSLSSIVRTSPPEPDRYRSNDNIQLFFPFDGGTENSTSAMNSLELPPISAVDHNSESEENMQNSLSTNSPNNAEVEQRNQDVAQETCQNNAEVEETNQDVAQQISHPQMDVEKPNQNVEQEQLVCKICPSSGPLEGGGDFQISWKKKSLEHIQPGYAYFGTEVVFLTKYNESVLEGKIPAGQEPGEVEVRVFSDTYEFLGETKFEYEDAINKFVSQALQHGLEWVSNVFVQTVKRVCSQSSSVNQGSSAKQNSGQATGALNDGCQDRSLPGANTVMEDEFEDLAQHFQDIVKWLSEQSFHPVHSNTDIWLKLSNAVDKLCRKLGFSDNFKGNQQTCPQEREENYFADTENSPYMLSEDDSTSLSDPDNWSETPNELPSKSGDDVKETWKTSTAPDDCPEKSFSPPLEDKPSDTTREVKDNKEEDLYPEVVKAAESMVTEHQFRPNNPTAGQANVVYRDGQNVLENRSLSCAGFSSSLLDASSLETASQFQQVIPSDAYGMDEEKKNGTVLKIETDPRLNSDDVSASGLPAVTLRSSWVLYSEERTSHTLSASRDDTPVPCRDIPALNVENGESQYQDDALFKPPYTNAIPKPSESIISVNSNQQSTTHPGPITQEVAQSPLSNPLWNRDSKLNMAPPQCSDEETHSGQEWEESVGEGLASWFDLCENEDAGKNEHSRWEMSSMEPNKTDGGVERDVFDSEEGLNQGQRLFSEQGNSHIHLPLPDDASVQSRRPEVENKESQDTLLFTAARNGHTDIVRLLIENGADVNKGERILKRSPLCEAAGNGHTDIIWLFIENVVDVNKEKWNTPLCEAAGNGHTDIVRLLIENGADVNKGERGTPLVQAVENGHTDIVRLLIENGADVNKEKWETPLCKAAGNGHTDIVRLLIENGADVNMGERNTPFCEAAGNDHTDIVRLLIENGADVNKGERETPLCKAAGNGHTDIVRLLIENGADVNMGERNLAVFILKNTPLCKAAGNGHTDIVRLLIENGADVNMGERLLWHTPLTGAVKNGHTDIARLLIENGADVNKGIRGTPLVQAVENGHTDIVRLLIKNGADINIGGRLFDLNPLQKAVEIGHCDIIKLLVDNGADFNIATLSAIEIELLVKSLRRKFEADAKDTKLSLERELDVQLRGKKTASLPKRPGKRLKTQTEMTSPRDIVEEGKSGKDSMTDVELGLNCLHLSPRCEQFKPYIMEESPGDFSIMNHDFKPINKRMDRVTLTDLGKAKQGHCVVVEIAKTHPSGDVIIIYGREINEEGSGVGEAFQLATKDLKNTWENEEMIAENVQIGSVVKYVQVGDKFLFQGNTKRPRWDMDRIFFSCTDGAHRGIGNAFPNSKLLTEDSYQDCTPKETSCFISLKCGVVENDRISVITKLGELLNLKLNCREDVILPLSPSTLELSHVEDNKDGMEMEEPLLISAVDSLRKPSNPVLSEGLNLRDKPKETSVEAEKPEADLTEKDDEDGNAF